MKQFFLGARRKAGVIVLVLALMFAGFWGRSHLFHESVYRYGPTSIHEISSEDGCLIWVCERRAMTPSHTLTGSLWEWQSQNAFEMTRASPIEVRDPLFFCDNIAWQWKWCDFNFGSGADSAVRRLYFIERTRARNDPKDIRQFSMKTHLLRDYYDQRTVWVVPY